MLKTLGRFTRHRWLDAADARRAVPPALARYGLSLAKGGTELVYRYDAEGEETAIVDLLQDLGAAGIGFADLHTTQRSLEEIFVSLVSEREQAAGLRLACRIAHRDPAQRHIPGRDQGLDPLPRQGRDGIRQRAVQPPAGGRFPNPCLDDGNPPVHVVRKWC